MPERIAYHDFNDSLRPHFDEEFDSAIKDFEASQSFTVSYKTAIQKYVPTPCKPKNCGIK